MSVRPPFPPQAFVFDLDGLLVDSEGRWTEAEQAVVASFEGTWDDAVKALLLGRGPESAAVALAAFLGGGVAPAEVERRMLAEALAAFARGTPPRPGALELVEELHQRVPMGIATNSRRVLAELALASSELERYFDVVICAEDVQEPKPAPDAYARACDRLGADPCRSVGLEDSPVGMRAASAAGLWVIGCPSIHGEPLDDADVVVASLRDLRADELLGT